MPRRDLTNISKPWGYPPEIFVRPVVHGKERGFAKNQMVF